MSRIKNQLEERIAEQLLRDHPHATDSVFDFLLYLVTAARQGHLCVEVTANHVSPLPQRLWQERSLLDGATIDNIPSRQQIIQGAKQLPLALVTDLSDFAAPAFTPLCRLGSRYYLHRHWMEESAFLQSLNRILASRPSVKPDREMVQRKVDLLINAGKLQPEQGAAIRCACEQTVTLISGGPGTGKTYTAGQFMALFMEALSEEERDSLQIAVAAPTGKAAAQLEASLARYCTIPVRAQTLHSLLGIRPHRAEELEISPHPADLFLIDEGSMIDLRMMGQLFGAMKPGARIVLLGDEDQLPSVGSGNGFADLLRSNKVPSVQLQRSLRTESEAILSLASCIRKGDASEALSQLYLKPLGPSLFDEVAAIFDWPSEDPEELLAHGLKFRLLSPLRKGPYGVDELNGQLVLLCRRRNRWQTFYAPIMITRNDESTGLSNGEVGLLVSNEYALFRQSAGGIKKISAPFLPPFEYAYCMSVHKSQGSEFDVVWFVAPEGSEVFGRELFYTAVTRAKKQLQVWGEPEIISTLITQRSERLSSIGEKI